MRPGQRRSVYSRVPPEDFVGRETELTRLLDHAARPDAGGILLLSAPGSGATELLTQIYDRLFREQTEIIPFYYAFRKSDVDECNTARRFAYEFLLQTVAFRRGDEAVICSGPGIDEIAELAAPADAAWTERLVEAYRKTGGDPADIRSLLSAPLRAAAHGARSFVLIDELHEGLANSTAEMLRTLFSRANAPYVLAGHRGAHFEQNTESLMRLGPLEPADCAKLVERAAEHLGVPINDESRDLIAVQAGGNPKFADAIVRSAADRSAPLDGFQKVQQIYAEAIFNGRLGEWFEQVLRRCAVGPDASSALLELLHTAANSDDGLALETWQRRIGRPEILENLKACGIVAISSNCIRILDSGEVLRDCIEARYRSDVAGENASLLFGESLSRYLSRAPKLMASHYRQQAAIGLADLLRSFSGQDVPLALVDYGRFRNEYKGALSDEIASGLKEDNEKIRLPRVFFVDDTASFYKPIEKLTEPNRSAIAFGFEQGGAEGQNEVVWIAAEVDSKLEVRPDAAEFWCDRLEMAAVVCSFKNYRFWLVSPEGFSSEALEILSSRNSFGSSRQQFELLREFLAADGEERDELESGHEIVLPMGEDAELIAANFAEQIALKHDFDAKSINQIKTAIVEACINAAEHSLSPDKKIRLRFMVPDDRIVITISNRGLRLTDKMPDPNDPGEGRRGWGIGLMRRLMDEVRIEQVDDGTSISMTKFRDRAEAGSGGNAPDGGSGGEQSGVSPAKRGKGK